MDAIPHPSRASILGGIALLIFPLMFGTQSHAAAQSHVESRTAFSQATPLSAEIEIPATFPTQGPTLQPGQVLVIASWACSFLQLDRVNALGLALVEDPLSRLVDQGQVVGWGQLNGNIRDEYNYHTFYLVESEEQYRAALRQVLAHIGGDGEAHMEEFYRHCSRTQEMTVRVVTARP
ncbi:MAG: hypothetical protein WEA09_06395 [Gemmatimonadota bacterium]